MKHFKVNVVFVLLYVLYSNSAVTMTKYLFNVLTSNFIQNQLTEQYFSNSRKKFNLINDLVNSQLFESRILKHSILILVPH